MIPQKPASGMPAASLHCTQVCCPSEPWRRCLPVKQAYPRLPRREGQTTPRSGCIRQKKTVSHSPSIRLCNRPRCCVLWSSSLKSDFPVGGKGLEGVLKRGRDHEACRHRLDGGDSDFSAKHWPRSVGSAMRASPVPCRAANAWPWRAATLALATH